MDSTGLKWSAPEARNLYKKVKHGRGFMGEDSGSTAHTAARTMLDTFASVGATGFDVTLTNRAGDKERFQRGVGLADLARTLPHMLDEATAKERNVIVRPHGPGVTFIQLDDLAADQLPRLAPAVFLALETSPGNFQAWLALNGKEDKEFARRLRKGTGADATASGATRVAGSLNFKDKYAPEFPRVAIREARAGHMTNAADLERLGLVAAPEVFTPLPEAPARSASNRKWPSYAICLDGAPFNSEENGPDRSRADFVWCMTAITWGFGVDAAAEQLMEQSSKARANGRDYAKLTARNAGLAVERRRQRPRMQRTAEHGRR
jgi:RepB DNA-primase from phage plasmid